jgi:hypothetical protein
MPLVIERHGDEISVAHYGELNGDLIRDPELTFSCGSDWTPTSITQDPVGRYAEVFPIVDGQHAKRVRPKLLRELKSFASLWARNLKEQGFTSDDVVATSLTHEALLTPAASPFDARSDAKTECRQDPHSASLQGTCGVPRARRPRR